MAHLAHHDRGFFDMVIILVAPNPRPIRKDNLDWIWDNECTVFFVEQPKEGPILKVGEG